MASPQKVLTLVGNQFIIKAMDKKRLSITHQKATGTYQRNQQIRRLYREGENMAEIGRMFKLPRQTIRRIVNEPGEE